MHILRTSSEMRKVCTAELSVLRVGRKEGVGWAEIRISWKSQNYPQMLNRCSCLKSNQYLSFQQSSIEFEFITQLSNDKKSCERKPITESKNLTRKSTVLSSTQYNTIKQTVIKTYLALAHQLGGPFLSNALSPWGRFSSWDRDLCHPGTTTKVYWQHTSLTL